MPNEGRKQNNTSFLATAAIGVAVGAIAAVGGYFFGKAQAEEEMKHEARAHRPTSSAASHSHMDGDELKITVLGGDARECGICFRAFEEVKRNDEAIHTTPCGHVYCNVCLQETLARNPVCPSCRSTVLPHETLRVFL